MREMRHPAATSASVLRAPSGHTMQSLAIESLWMWQPFFEFKVISNLFWTINTVQKKSES